MALMRAPSAARFLCLASILAGEGTGQEKPGDSRSKAVAYGALPIRNIAGTPGAGERVLGLLRQGLEARGAIFAAPLEVERVLRARRIRYTDSVSRADARALGAALDVRYILAGALLDHSPGPAPRVSLTLRVIAVSSGRRVASTLVTARGEDFRGWLGLGAITDEHELLLEAVNRALAAFDSDGLPVSGERGKSRNPRRGALSHFHREGFDPLAVESVAVMPLDNRTRRPEAGLTFAEILGHEFHTFGVDVVEQSELRAAMIRRGVRSLQFLDRQFFEEIGREVGVRYFVLGSIDLYDEEVFVEDERLPEVEATIRMLDAATGQLIAAASVHRRGDDYHSVLGLGTVHDLYDLSDRAAHDLIAWMGWMGR